MTDDGEGAEGGTLAPRENPDLVGHDEAERTLVESARAGRLAHAWLISGPRGIGKATLAYRFARYLFAQDAARAPSLFGAPEAAPASAGMAMAADAPLFRRVASGGHADLRVVGRSVNPENGRLRNEIVVADVRALGDFLRLTPFEGGWRVAIVDCADEMNRSAANAVLKVLEEPPSRAVLLLVSHNPGRLLATIRSRCRKLALKPLDEGAVETILARHRPELDAASRRESARLAGGSVGRAIELADAGGADLYREVLEVVGRLPDLDFARVQRFAAEATAEDGFELAADLLRLWHARFLAGAASGRWPEELAAGEGALFRRLAEGAALDRWFEVWEKNDRLFSRADGLNLDHRQVLLNAFLALESAARP